MRNGRRANRRGASGAPSSARAPPGLRTRREHTYAQRLRGSEESKELPPSNSRCRRFFQGWESSAQPRLDSETGDSVPAGNFHGSPAERRLWRRDVPVGVRPGRETHERY